MNQELREVRFNSRTNNREGQTGWFHGWVSEVDPESGAEDAKALIECEDGMVRRYATYCFNFMKHPWLEEGCDGQDEPTDALLDIMNGPHSYILGISEEEEAILTLMAQNRGTLCYYDTERMVVDNEDLPGTPCSEPSLFRLLGHGLICEISEVQALFYITYLGIVALGRICLLDEQTEQ